MKYLISYESLVEEPKVGDYVYCNVNTMFFSDLQFFLDNNIGRIIKIDNLGADGGYITEFEKDDIDYNIIKYQMKKHYKKDKIVIGFNRNEIKMFSSDKEDVEIYIKTLKYNL